LIIMRKRVTKNLKILSTQSLEAEAGGWGLGAGLGAEAEDWGLAE
jgi:hypothetical protein